MNAKKCFLTVTFLSVVLLTLATSLWPTKHNPKESGKSSRMALSGPIGKFGPVIELVVPAAQTDEASDILDLESGRAIVQPSFEYFNFHATAVMTWIRSNRLDISSSVWSSSAAACVTHGMAIVAVEGKSWNETTEEELQKNPALVGSEHYPRRLLVLGDDRPDTYLFRTSEGTMGMLQLVGVGEQGQGVHIRYKLINPDKVASTLSVVASNLSRLK